MKLFFLLFCIFSLLIKIDSIFESFEDELNDENAATTDVINMGNEFANFLGSTSDKLEILKTISKRNAAFLSLLEPVGTVFATSLTTVLDHDSPELLAIKKLGETMTQEFEATIKAVQDVIGNLEEFIVLYDYSNQVSLRFTNFHMNFSKATNIQLSAAVRKDAFFYACTGDHSNPVLAINWLYQSINFHCAMPTIQDKQLYVNASIIFRNIELHENWIEALDNYELYKNRLYIQMKHSSESTNSNLLQKLSNLIGESRTYVVSALRTLTLDQSGPSKLFCLLNSVGIDNEFERKPFYAISDLIKMDMLSFEFVGGLCAKFLNNEQAAIDHDINYLNKTVVGTLEKMGHWIEAKLNLAWEDVVDQKVKDIITKSIASNKYNETANRVRDKLNLVGPELYRHIVFIMPNLEYPLYYRVEVLGFRCLVVENHNGIHIFVSRHEINATNRLVQAKEWFKQNQELIMTVLDQEYLIDYMDKLAKEIDKQIGGLHRQDRYATVIIMHNANWPDSDCKIEMGLSTNHYIGGLPVYDTILFHKNPGVFSNSIQTNIYFLL